MVTNNSSIKHWIRLLSSTPKVLDLSTVRPQGPTLSPNTGQMTTVSLQQRFQQIGKNTVGRQDRSATLKC